MFELTNAEGECTPGIVGELIGAEGVHYVIQHSSPRDRLLVCVVALSLTLVIDNVGVSEFQILVSDPVGACRHDDSDTRLKLFEMANGYSAHTLALNHCLPSAPLSGTV